MQMTHLSEEDLVLIYYNEPGAERGHLAECERCRAAAQALARVLDSCNAWQAPEPEPAFGRILWARIATQLEPRGRQWKWLYACCAAAAVLLVAFLAGRYSQPPSILPGLSPQAQRRILEITLADHLDRAEVLLTEMSNTGAPVDRAQARDLVEEGRLLRQSLAREEPGATLAMLDDLERFLLEAANAPAPGAGKLRERIASDSLLFKVRIIQANLRTEGQRL